MDNLFYHLSIAVRLILSCILGGIIGAERESENKNAGFRTHILVCVASALVMITSEYIFKFFQGLDDFDPTRMGAQVISGIGFLGAGAILKEGVNIRGLTTAASVWAVACVGLAVGAGFYEGALLSTLLILIVLVSLKKFRTKIKKQNYYHMAISVENLPVLLSNVSEILQKYSSQIENFKVSTSMEGIIWLEIEPSSITPLNKAQFIFDIQKLNGVKSVEEF